jgi:predicted ATP-dependent endonuclease of OLD family
MSKIKTIRVENFKAISQKEVILDGQSIMMVAANNQGKSSILKGLIDRFQSVKPPVIVKEGESKGFNEMELTDGSVIKWSFTEKTESFTFTTKEGIKMTTGVLKAIGERYFGKKFSIDDFIASSSTKQTEKVLEILGVDTSRLDADYKEQYDLRADANRELKRLRAFDYTKPIERSKPDLDGVKEKKEALIKSNKDLQDKWTKENEEHQKETLEFNDVQEKLRKSIQFISKSISNLKEYEGSVVGSFIDFKGMEDLLKEVPEPKPTKQLTSLDQPAYNSLQEIDQEIEDVYKKLEKYNVYSSDVKTFNDWRKEGLQAKANTQLHEDNLKSILEQKANLVANANMPKEFTISEDNNLLYNGFPLSTSQISTSSKYIAALKLGALVIGDIKALHFDCSFLDKNSLNEVLSWSTENGYQLLVEKPDWEGGDITYEIINE